MIVEDSLVVRQLLAHIVMQDQRLSLVAAVASAEEALQELPRVRPDVISMDVRLPGMDGLEATRRIMADQPTPIVVVAAGVDDAALNISMNALKAGALSVVEKPVGITHRDYMMVAEQIRTQLYIMSQVPVIRQRLPRPPARTSAVAARGPRLVQPEVVAIAASTGGPQALSRLLSMLPPDFPLPILLVQHMGAAFMRGFAVWLDHVVPQTVRLANDGERPEAAMVYVAPGDRHLEFTSAGLLRVSAEPPIRNQRPAATTLFRSLGDSAGAKAVGIVLTGMGDDGAAGLLDLRRAGGYVIAEHESSAIVNGMPAAARRIGAVDVSLPLDAIAPHLLNLMRRDVTS